MDVIGLDDGINITGNKAIEESLAIDNQKSLNQLNQLPKATLNIRSSNNFAMVKFFLRTEATKLDLTYIATPPPLPTLSHLKILK